MENTAYLSLLKVPPAGVHFHVFFTCFQCIFRAPLRRSASPRTLEPGGFMDVSLSHPLREQGACPSFFDAFARCICLHGKT